MVWPLGQEDPLEKGTWWLSGKESACNAGDAKGVGSIPGSGRSLREGNGNPLPYSCLENPMTGDPGGL